MPPKSQVFKTPDGKEFSSKTEWRDYMFATFYSFKNRSNEVEPLIKKPGDIDGQMFDIADCDNVTIVIMDVVEQVQIDQVKNSRVFIGACASSIFIRNCENCVFYTCCRQLRLRDVTKSSFYIYSMSEVHIEFTNEVKFAPFNGGYPEHGSHLSKASLDVKHNLWYDIFDHNDPGKSHVNWSLIPESEYETSWYPAGVACDLAVPLTKPGAVVREPIQETMQSFSIHSPSATTSSATSATAPAIKPAVTTASPVSTEIAPSVLPQPVVVAEVHEKSVDELAITAVIKAYASYKACDDISGYTSSDFSTTLANASTVQASDMSLVIAGGELHTITSIKASASMAWAKFWIANQGGGYVNVTGVFEKTNDTWKLVHVHRSYSITVVPTI